MRGPDEGDFWFSLRKIWAELKAHAILPTDAPDTTILRTLFLIQVLSFYVTLNAFALNQYIPVVQKQFVEHFTSKCFS